MLSLIQLLRKWQYRHLGTEPNTEQCDITDQLLNENDNIYIWEQKPRLLNMANAGKRQTKILPNDIAIACMI